MAGNDKNKLLKSAASRMARLGGLAGRVGVSMAGNTISNLFRDPKDREAQQSAVLMKNALRVKEALGELKGVPMKIGQMLSLHEDFLPREVVRVLQSLQQKAPSVPFAQIHAMIRRELGENYKFIAEIDEEAMAAASIGQVHRAVLTDGRRIVLKVQYPGIDEVIRSDLKTLRGIMRTVFFMFIRMDIDAIWEEMRDRLVEELDYTHEAENMRRMAAFLRDDTRIRIPRVIGELTTRHVLAMEKIVDIPPETAADAGYPDELRNAWGESIFAFILDNLFRFRFLHADPNLSNFSFREDGGLVVYDFGCMKEIPEELSRNYVRLVVAVLEHDYPAIPGILKRMGIHKADGRPVSWEMIKDYADEIQDIVRPGKTYTFGINGDVYRRIQELGQKYIGEFMTMVYPKDIIFIDRTFIGHFGNLNRLKASADWRTLIVEHLKDIPG